MSPSKPNANLGSNWRAIPVKIARWATWLPKRRSSWSSVAPRTSRGDRLLALPLERLARLARQVRGALAEACLRTRGPVRPRDLRRLVDHVPGRRLAWRGGPGGGGPAGRGGRVRVGG